MSLTIDNDGNNIVLFIHGRFDQTLKTEIDKIIDISHPGLRQIVLELSACDGLDSYALGVLLVLRDRLGGINSKLIIKGANYKLQNFFKLTHFDRLFEIR